MRPHVRDPRRPGPGVRARRRRVADDAAATSGSPRRSADGRATSQTTDGHAPLVIDGSELHPIRYELPVASAQVKSAVLLAGLFAEDGPTTVVEEFPTRDHTERMFDSLGVRIAARRSPASVWPVERLEPFELEMPGDFSSAAPFITAAALLSGSVS